MELALLSLFNEDETEIIQLSQNGVVRFNNRCLSSDFFFFFKPPLERHQSRVKHTVLPQVRVLLSARRTIGVAHIQRA